MDMVEERWGISTVDDIIEATRPGSGGAYTSVENYAFAELEAYLGELHDITGLSVRDLIIEFGNYLAASFVSKFPEFFAGAACTFDVLKRVDDHIHVDVLRLHPDAVLPSFSYTMKGENEMLLRYESVRNLVDLVEGIVLGCAKAFGEKLVLERKVISESAPTIAEFTIVKRV
jgi:hypothetical protein